MMNKHISWLYALIGWLWLAIPASGQTQWTLITSCVNCTNYNSVGYGDGQWVVIGDNGKILTSTDGITWTTRTSNTTENLRAIAYRTGQWLAVGTNGITLTSVDGINWTINATDPANELDGVDYGDGLWIAVGKTNNIPAGYGVMFTSVDGITWTNQPIARQLSYQLNKVKYLNGAWYVVGGDMIATSANGYDWTPQRLEASFVTSIAYGAGLFVAGILDAGFATSTTGTNWASSRISPSMRINDVSYGDGQWIAVGSPNTGGYSMLTSIDGKNWTVVNVPTANNLNSVYYASGRWIAVGKEFTILTNPVVLAAPLGVLSVMPILLKVYPNPGSGVTTLESESPISSINIYSVLGEVVEHHEFKQSIHQYTLEFSNRPAGRYLIVAHTSDNKLSVLPYIKR